MAKNKFRPAGEKHAITEAAFVVHFGVPLSSSHFETLRKNRRQWAFLAAHKEMRIALSGVPIPVDLQEFVPSDVKELEFARVRPDGSREWVMKARDDFLVVNCMAYTRWNSVWKRVRDYLEKATGALSKSKVAIVGLSLNYNDVFIWEGHSIDYDATKLFKRDCPYLTPNSFRSGALWHCHTGWFVRDKAHEPGRLLTRVHIEAVERNEEFATQLRTEQWLAFDKHRTRPFQVFGRKNQTSPALIDRCMEFMHNRDKDLLSEMLVDEMIEDISLWTPEDEE